MSLTSEVDRLACFRNPRLAARAHSHHWNHDQKIQTYQHIDRTPKRVPRVSGSKSCRTRENFVCCTTMAAIPTARLCQLLGPWRSRAKMGACSIACSARKGAPVFAWRPTDARDTLLRYLNAYFKRGASYVAERSTCRRDDDQMKVAVCAWLCGCIERADRGGERRRARSHTHACLSRTTTVASNALPRVPTGKRDRRSQRGNQNGDYEAEKHA